MNILITGGSGFIGNALIKHFTSINNKIVILTRDKKSIKPSANFYAISDLNELNTSLEFDCIINLAGAPINKRWTKKYKLELLASRINTTKKVIGFIKKLQYKPKLFISASAIGYYGSQEHKKPLTEEANFNSGFTHELCSAWENEAMHARQLGVRTCIARLGVVLGGNGGALSAMLLPFKLGLGGKIGDGKQMFSWVALDDVINAFDFFITNEHANGIYNITAPNPVCNEEFTKILGKILHRPTFFTLPKFVIKMLFGEMGEELLLRGQNVIPQKLQQEGFKFQYPELENALIKAIR